MHKSLRKAILLGALTICAPAAAQESLSGLFSQKSTQGQPAKVDTPPAARQVATRLSTFGIPITAPAKREGVKEIQLHVSADQGKTWHLYYRVAPTDKFFPFKAAADGEYWFATRVVDSSLRAAPEADLRPEMRVLIDTTPPRLLLTSEITPSGEIVAKWQATDSLLSTQSLKLEYQTSPTGQWRSIAIPSSGDPNKNGVLAGKVAWFPRESSGAIINLRAEILDQAGNHAVALDRLEQGAIARSAKPLEPPIAGPASPPKEDKPQGEGTFSSVSKWLGGAFGGAPKSQSAPEDPYASSMPSDSLAGSEPLSPSAKQTQKPPSNWSTSNTELTDAGIRRIPASRGVKPDDIANVPAGEPGRHRTEKRGPGRLASASTVREPKREAVDEERDGQESTDEQRPSIQPPENSGRHPSATEGDVNREGLSTTEAEEIPPPRPEPRLAPANPDDETIEPKSAPRTRAESTEQTTNRPTSRPGAVESLPREDSRTPIPSAPRKKPGEYRVRSPITSGLKGDEKGIARPPATAPYRNASTARDTIESTASSGRLPAGIEPIYSNQLRFGLEYDVNTVGSSGVSEVELWATRDGGQSWSRWGSDPDRRSPFDIEVDGEGVFGFRIVVMSRGGLASRPPQPGDEADQWIVVDTTAPKLGLRGAGYGSEERVGQLEISWDAQDANLTEKSISLYYSDREEGPWTRIVSDLANQGEYFWRVDSRIPPRIFIKAEVRDGAGNVASDQTRDAIKVEGLVPSGKIRRIVPREDSKE